MAGAILLSISGVIILVSEFLFWTFNDSAYNLYQLSTYSEPDIVYLFPFICGLIICVSSFLIIFVYGRSRWILYILLVLSLNLEFFFMLDMFNLHGSYLWDYPGLYANLSGVFLMLFGFLYLFSASIKTSNEQNSELIIDLNDENCVKNDDSDDYQ